MVDIAAHFPDSQRDAPVAKPALMPIVNLPDLLVCVLVLAAMSAIFNMVVKITSGHFKEVQKQFKRIFLP